MILPRCARIALLLTAAFASAGNAAEPLSRSFPLDFFRDIPSRNLKGLAARSDGRLTAGPVFTDLAGPSLGDLLWCIEPAGENRWLIGTGPDGKIVEVTLDAAKMAYTTREVADLEEPQVFALKRLPDGSILAGTSPNGALLLLRDGKVTARVGLPVDSIFDIQVLPSSPGGARGKSAAPDLPPVLVATGNPGRIYHVDLKKFSGAGLNAEKITAAKSLEEKGIVLFGEVQDRNVRRIALLDGQVVAGSSPRGNLYLFRPEGGDPTLLQENRDAEVSALLTQDNGDLFAALVFATTQNDARINRPAPPKPEGVDAPPPSPPPPSPSPAERFTGRSVLVHVPKNGFPETAVARTNLAFYTLARRGDTILIGGGEQGDLLGYDTRTRLSLSFAGSSSSQVNQVTPLPGQPDKFLALRNNTPGLALLNFAATGDREAETRRLDLGMAARLGALRFGSLRNLEHVQVGVQVRTSWTSDEAEGWRPWQVAELRDDGWLAENTARYVKVKIKAPATATSFILDRAALHFLPLNRRPALAEFRVLPPHYAAAPSPETSSSPAIATMTQLLGSDRERGADEKRKGGILTSPVAPQPGNQIVYWSVTDPDNDALTYTFSIRHEKAKDWTDLAVNIRDNFVQFDLGPLEDGAYATRLSATEQAPRPAAERQTVTFETEDFLVDKTAPAITDARAFRENEALVVTVSARDNASLLSSLECAFNNGYRDSLSHPADGIRDSRTETFVLRVPLVKAAGATSVEVTVYDELTNATTRRLEIK